MTGFQIRKHSDMPHGTWLRYQLPDSADWTVVRSFGTNQYWLPVLNESGDIRTWPTAQAVDAWLEEDEAEHPLWAYWPMTSQLINTTL